VDIFGLHEELSIQFAQCRESAWSLSSGAAVVQDFFREPTVRSVAGLIAGGWIFS
jgi:hypothetical protein